MLSSPCCPIMVLIRIRLFCVSLYLFLRKGYVVVFKTGNDLMSNLLLLEVKCILSVTLVEVSLRVLAVIVVGDLNIYSIKAVKVLRVKHWGVDVKHKTLLNLPFVHDGDRPHRDKTVCSEWPDISLGCFQMLGGELLCIFRNPKDLYVVPFGLRLAPKQPGILPASVPVDDFFQTRMKLTVTGLLDGADYSGTCAGTVLLFSYKGSLK